MGQNKQQPAVIIPNFKLGMIIIIISYYLHLIAMFGLNKPFDLRAVDWAF